MMGTTGIALFAADACACLDAVDIRHHDVEQDQIDGRWLLRRRFTDAEEAIGFRRGSDGVDSHVAGRAKHGSGDVAPVFGVVDDQNAHWRTPLISVRSVA